ncbi:MAG: hypothetical protein IPN76_28020 [Saprospiraceae bacterium]|nr:hypothetical protein [Saprospiraceae bacterium]
MNLSSINRIARSPIFMGFMVATIFLATFFEVAAKSTPATLGYTHTELFKAIYFLEGDLVNRVPALQKFKSYVPKDEMRQNVEMQNGIISEFNKIDPSFMQRLHDAVADNDHYRISSTIKEGGELQILAVSKHLRKMGNTSIPSIDRFDLSTQSGRQGASAMLMSYYGGLDNFPEEYGMQACALLAVAIAVAVVLFVYFWVETSSVANPDSYYSTLLKDTSISHDRLVSQLVALD